MTKQSQNLIQMESNYQVKKIELQKKIDKKKNDKKIAEIEAQMMLEKAKTEIEA